MVASHFLLVVGLLGLSSAQVDHCGSAQHDTLWEGDQFKLHGSARSPQQCCKAAKEHGVKAWSYVPSPLGILHGTCYGYHTVTGDHTRHGAASGHVGPPGPSPPSPPHPSSCTDIFSQADCDEGRNCAWCSSSGQVHSLCVDKATAPKLNQTKWKCGGNFTVVE